MERKVFAVSKSSVAAVVLRLRSKVEMQVRTSRLVARALEEAPT